LWFDLQAFARQQDVEAAIAEPRPAVAAKARSVASNWPRRRAVP
jgi:hypothetical protein